MPLQLESPIGNDGALRAYNAESLEKSIFNLYESDEVTSIMINYPALLLRKKSALYPEGRTSYRFKHALRRHVTVSGQSMFAPKKVKKLKRPVVPCELDLPETDETLTENEQRAGGGGGAAATEALMSSAAATISGDSSPTVGAA